MNIDIELILCFIAVMSVAVVVIVPFFVAKGKGVASEEEAVNILCGKRSKFIISGLLLLFTVGTSLLLYDKLGAKEQLETIEVQQKGRKVLLEILASRRKGRVETMTEESESGASKGADTELE